MDLPLPWFKGKLNEPLNERQVRVVNLIKNKTDITVLELAKECSSGRETIKRDITKLQKLNIIERIGSKKTGHWKVVAKLN